MIYYFAQKLKIDLFEFSSINVSIAISIEYLESLSELGRVVLLLCLLSHHLKELIEVNCPVPVDVVLYHQVEHLVLRGILSHGSHDW